MPAAPRGTDRSGARDPAQDQPRGEERLRTRRRVRRLSGSANLLRKIREEILDQGPVSFARFMELALYDPEHGYYSNAGAIGARGDFVTASDTGPLWGACLASQLEELDERLGRPRELRVVEFGAGRGLLARDVMAAWEQRNGETLRRLRYTCVDRSAAMREAARQNAPSAEVVAPDDLRTGGDGCVLAVELFDALPVHRVRRVGGSLREIVVGLADDGGLTELDAAPTAAVTAYAERYRAAPEEGDEAEIGLAADAWMDRLLSALDRGFVLVVDYGLPAARLYDRKHRRGSLLAYHRHTINEEYLERVGRQDLTAHVNFTALEDRAADRNARHIGTTTQDRFLIGNGILSVFESDDEVRHDPAGVRQRQSAMTLIHPGAMGRRFKVAVFAKNVDAVEPLRGLVDPFERARRPDRA